MFVGFFAACEFGLVGGVLFCFGVLGVGGCWLAFGFGVLCFGFVWVCLFGWFGFGCGCGCGFVLLGVVCVCLSFGWLCWVF